MANRESEDSLKKRAPWQKDGFTASARMIKYFDATRTILNKLKHRSPRKYKHYNFVSVSAKQAFDVLITRYPLFDTERSATQDKAFI